MISSEVDKKKVKADSRGRYVLIVLSVFEKDLGIYRYDAGSPTRWLRVVVLVTVKNCAIETPKLTISCLKQKRAIRKSTREK